MNQLGMVADIDLGWTGPLGARAIKFVFGQTGESTVEMILPAIPSVPMSKSKRSK